MSIEKNTIAANTGSVGNLVGDTLSQGAGMAQAALEAVAVSTVQTYAAGGNADAQLDQDAEAKGSEDNTSFGDFNVQF